MLNPCASVVIENRSDTPAYSQLVTQLKGKILSGEVENGDRLPPSRTLASSLGLSRRLVVVAYESLVAEGLLESRQGDGTYCVYKPQISASSQSSAPELLGMPNKNKQSALEKAYTIKPLSPKGIDVGALSLKTWSSAAARAQRNLSVSHLFGALPGGLPSLKDGVAKHLLSLRGLFVEPSQIVITAGIRDSLDLAVEVAGGFDRVAVEDPSNPRIRELLRNSTANSRVNFLALPVDRDGARFESIDDPTSLAAIHVTPSHQYPMGITLSFERRLELLDTLKHTDCWILENDYGAGARYSGQNIKSLFELDTRRRTIYFGTLSNILFSNLHLSFMVVPERFVTEFIAAQERKRSFGSIVAQAALSEFIECGAFAKHMLELRKRSKRNYFALFSEVQEKLDYWLDPLPIEGGMNFVALAKDPDFPDVAIATAAASRGVSPTAVSSLFHDEGFQTPGLLFGFMGTSASVAAKSVDILREIILDIHQS